MSVISMEFFVFCAIVAVLYYIVPKKIQWWVLLAASTAFFMFSGVQYIVYILFSALISYFTARAIGKNFEKQKAAVANLEKPQAKEVKKKMKSQRFRILLLGLLFVLGELVVLKYTYFFFSNINSLIGIVEPKELDILKFAVPLGCSFYTFAIVGYMVDVYRKKIGPQTNFAKYFLFVSYFPHITQGPIPRYDQLGSQLFAPHKFNFEQTRDGLMLVLWGLFKKIVIASKLSTFVSSAYDNGNYYSESGYILLVASILFSLQMYADFSGYVDIVSGISEIFGIKLGKNFERPYFAQTLPEFWRRWHISLSSWFREYVFYPMSASKTMLNLNKNTRAKLGDGAGKVVSIFIPVMTVWGLTGFWHGSNWTYITWGLYHGTLIMLSIIFEQSIENFNQRLHIKTDCFSWKLFRALRTFMICTIGRVFFRAESLRAAARILLNMVTNFGTSFSLTQNGLDAKDLLIVGVGLIAMLIVSAIQEKAPFREQFNKQNVWFRWALLILLIFATVVFGDYGPVSKPQTFIYEQF